jgi:methylmalonyl-CoA mutase C-terminal domain/subunit
MVAYLLFYHNQLSHTIRHDYDFVSFVYIARRICYNDWREMVTIDYKRKLVGNELLMAEKIRILIAKPGLDGHDRGAKVIARALRDAGFEVIYTGLRQTPEMIADAALQEDVDIVGLSILSGAHMALVPRIREVMNESDLADLPIIIGGIIPDADKPKLAELGVEGIFGPGASTTEIVERINDIVRQRGERSAL